MCQTIDQYQFLHSAPLVYGGDARCNICKSQGQGDAHGVPFTRETQYVAVMLASWMQLRVTPFSWARTLGVARVGNDWFAALSGGGDHIDRFHGLAEEVRHRGFRIVPTPRVQLLPTRALDKPTHSLGGHDLRALAENDEDVRQFLDSWGRDIICAAPKIIMHVIENRQNYSDEELMDMSLVEVRLRNYGVPRLPRAPRPSDFPQRVEECSGYCRTRLPTLVCRCQYRPSARPTEP